MPSVDEDLTNMFLAIAGVGEGRLTLAEAVAEIKTICNSRPLLPDGGDDYLQVQKVLDLPLPADDEGIEVRCESLSYETALINLCRGEARGQL
ncbi:MAG: hypothetical protein KTV68_00230 [Acidimicrobiia bacterium]|nr:hypothetical protein [Acidimicrobiia bacterium]MCY4433007.1 hypothetical protein [bacterium]